MIANLMMYARPELDAAHDRYWALIRENLRAAGIDGPEQLSQNAEEFHVWRHPDLVLSQTCGMPYRLWLHGKTTLVGTPDFGLEGCAPGYYNSAIIIRRDDPRTALAAFRNARFAYNMSFSQSGYAAPYWHLQTHGFWFGDRQQSGGHLHSAQAVAEGRADIAALDAMTWRLIVRYEPWAAQLRVLEWTEPTPGLPLITATGRDTGTVFDAVARAIDQLTQDDRTALSLKGIVRIPPESYLSVPNPPDVDYGR